MLTSNVEVKLKAAYDRWRAKRDALAERWDVEAVDHQQALDILRSARAPCSAMRRGRT